MQQQLQHAPSTVGGPYIEVVDVTMTVYRSPTASAKMACRIREPTEPTSQIMVMAPAKFMMASDIVGF